MDKVVDIAADGLAAPVVGDTVQMSLGDWAPRDGDAGLAESAQAKRARGEGVSDKELRAEKRVARSEEEILAREVPRRVPKGIYCEMVGRANQVVDSQQDLYGIPVRGRTVDVFGVCRWIHDFLRDNRVGLMQARRVEDGEGDLMLAAPGEGSPALERYRDEKAKLARLDRLGRERELLPRDEVRQLLVGLASDLRGCGEVLQREYGAGAWQVLAECLGEFERKVGEGLEPRMNGDERG